jgi:hypothetical protein
MVDALLGSFDQADLILRGAGASKREPGTKLP